MAGKRAPVTAPELLLKIVLTGTLAHYDSRIFDEQRLERLLLAGKKILHKSHQDSEVRQNLGFSPAVWQGLTAVLSRAIPVLEQQSFAWQNNSGEEYESSSSDLIAANYLPLVKDIERLNDLCTIARNLLATTRRSQNLAAEKAFDQQILKLIDVCVRVTARGFDGENNGRTQEKWQKVVNLYKRLLITCLQFLHNFIMHNEHRKLVLWLDLFGNTSVAAQQAQQREILAVQEQLNREHARKEYYRARLASPELNGAAEHVENPQIPPIQTDTQETDDLADDQADPGIDIDLTTFKNINDVTAADLGYSIDDVHALFDLMSAGKALDVQSRDRKTALMQKIRADLERMSGLTAAQLDDNPDILLRAGAALREHLALRDAGAKTAAQKLASLPGPSISQLGNLPDLTTYANLAAADQPITAEDLTMPRTSSSAAETLQEAKDELMARLQDNQPLPVQGIQRRHSHRVSRESSDEERSYHTIQGSGKSTRFKNDESHLDDYEHDDRELQDDDKEDDAEVEAEVEEEEELDDDDEDEDEDEDEDIDGQDDDDDDYQHIGDQERGLLTDVPLVLGPTEIEALPMIIQAGIVDNFGAKNSNSIERQGARNMQAVRCHILLAQEAGRNVLRELLIFIAAWDLPDDEFYFKMMVQIMEAILKNGLMSHAYSDFGQAKDIISPAQAVVIKILTHIFRTRYCPSKSTQNGNGTARPQRPRVPSPLIRVDILTVRYIFTVFRGNIIPETCALIYLQGQIRANLAIAEDFPLNLWDMERVYEGVYQFLEFFAVLTENNDWKQLLIEWEIVYDLVTLIKELDASIPKASLVSSGPANGRARPRDRQGFRGNPSNAHASFHSHGQNLGDQGIDQSNSKPLAGDQDPSEFEWRNLKKLIVLVLSSLVWGSPTVQDQIRQHGGVPVILSCTNHDGHNPHILEHAIMCVRFLLEGNKENQAIIRELEAKGVANSAELERDFNLRASVRNGQVHVEPKQGRAMPATPGRSNASARRASEGTARPNLDGLDTMAQMTEKFQRLGVNSQSLHNAVRSRPEMPSLPVSQSIRRAFEEAPPVELHTDENEAQANSDDEGNLNQRVVDVGDLI